MTRVRRTAVVSVEPYVRVVRVMFQPTRLTAMLRCRLACGHERLIASVVEAPKALKCRECAAARQGA